MGQTTRHHWAINIKHSHHPLTVCIRKTYKLGRRVLVLVLVLVLVVAAFGSIICPACLQHYNIICLHHPLAVCIRKNICTHQHGVGLHWVVTASGSVI
jgi:hypothetical protein